MKRELHGEIPPEILEAAKTMSEEEFNARKFQMEVKEVTTKTLTFLIVDGELRLYM